MQIISALIGFGRSVVSDPIALFTFILAISTIGLWSATICLYRAGERQTKLTRELFTLNRRALLNLGKPTILIRDDSEEILLGITATNVGKSLASVVEIRAVARRYGVRLNPTPDSVEDFCLSLVSASDQKRGLHIILPNQSPQIFTSDDTRITTVFEKGRSIEVIFCATYRADGVDRLLHTGGYATFYDTSADDPDEDGWREVKIVPHNFRVTFAD